MSGQVRRPSKESILRSSDIFARLPKADLRALATKFRRRAFPAGATLFREGESGEELFVLASGRVAITLGGGDSEEIVLSRLGPGAFFGEMAILERAPRSASCAALEESECLILGARDFEALLSERPSAAVGVLERMLAISAGRLVNTGAFLSEMVRWGDAARKRAITDAATGLFNRRYLEDSFGTILARAAREGTGLSFAMFDLDRFGKLNAAYGAEFCDRLVVEVSRAFKRAFGEEDILVRWGGDEFCFLLPGPAGEAERKCGLACDLLRGLWFPGHPELRVTCSIGLAHFTGPEDVKELKDRADKALYLAKESGRDRAIAWPGAEIEEPKREPASIAARRRTMASVIKALEERDDFLILGHVDPDEDCLSSMVAFALLASKLGKRASIALAPASARAGEGAFGYLFGICRYNSIGVLTDGPPPRCSALVLVDTPKPSLIDRPELYEKLRRDPGILKIELDHHLAADSRYFGQPGYRLVLPSSSTCEIIGMLATRMEADPELLARHQIEELLSRNLVLCVLSGMLADTQMGRFIQDRRQRGLYELFSSRFECLLAEKTHSGSGNFSTKEQVFEALAAISADERSCHDFMLRRAELLGPVALAVFDAGASRALFENYGNDTVVAMAKAVVDELAERTGRLGLLGYYDEPERSPFVQFRLRRAGGWDGLDLREALGALGIENGGGHPGAVGFRVERDALPDIEAAARDYARRLGELLERPGKAGG